jgi:hypothetical protein
MVMPVDIINTTKEVLKAVQKYNDVELMNKVYTLQAALLELQGENIELRKQLDEAHATLAIRQSIRKRGEYFYKDSEQEPLCPKCWQQDEKLVYLSALKTAHWGKFRACIVCRSNFTEEKYDSPMQIRPRWNVR